MKVQRPCCFLVVCLLMFQVGSFGQEKQQFTYKNSQDKDLSRLKGWNNSTWQKIITLNGKTAQRIQPGFFLLNPLPASFYSDHLGIICRKELQLDKLTPIPFRFRLGSLDYVNWMERKPNAIKGGLK